VESACEFGIEPSGSMKCWETIEWLTSSGLTSSARLHIGSYEMREASFTSCRGLLSKCNECLKTLPVKTVWVPLSAIVVQWSAT
jgi:hypothetical protein